MAIYDLPSTRFIECTFTLDDGTVSSAFNRGMSFNVTQVVDPSFRVKIQTMPLDQAGMQAWTSWKAKQRGGLNTFRAYDTSRPTPLHYAGARTPADIASGWAGTGLLASKGTGGAISLSGLPAGYIAKEGDRIALEQNGYVGLFEIVVADIANGAGSVDLTVHPIVHNHFSAGAVARLWRPMGLFRIDWRTWGMSVSANPSSIAFEGHQVLQGGEVVVTGPSLDFSLISNSQYVPLISGL